MARLKTWWSRFGHLTAQRGITAALLGILTFLACLAIEQTTDPDRIPEVHDEFAYLLAGDTFAHARLTNPPHPLARSLETFHVLQTPTLQAKYPPAQGLFIALGTVLSGRPIVGVMISAALFISALCWALQSWFPPRWAAIGAALAAITMVLSGEPIVTGWPGYWSQTFWGGAVAALGGCLVVGGTRRLTSHPTTAASAALGLGTTILALSRPFEGLLVCIPAGVFLLAWLFRARDGTLSSRVLKLVPAALVVAAGLAWLAYYNWRVTGDALTLPYMLYRERYQMLPIWRWQDVRPEPPGLNQEMLNYAHLELQAGQFYTPPLRRLADYARTFAFEAGPVLAALVVLMLPWTLRRRAVWWVIAAVVFVLAGMWLGSYYEVHYHAPAAVLTVILLTASLRQLALMHKGPRPLWVAATALAILSTVAVARYEWVAWMHLPRRMLQHWAASRQEVIDTLVKQGGAHVVFVAYSPRHSPHSELVYNSANIDQQPVVWVRSLDDAQNQAVLDYYKNRKAWLMLIENDNGLAKVIPYSP